MTSSADDLEIEADEGEVRFRLTDGTLLGAGPEAKVVPALQDAMARLQDAPDWKQVGSIELNGRDLLVTRTDDGMALIWRDGRGADVGRVEMTNETADAFVVWLGTLGVAPPDIDWATRRVELLGAIREATAVRLAAEHGDASSAEIGLLRARIEDLRRRYVDSLPHRLVARHPIDGSPVRVALDDGGLDGPFWDAQNPARPADTMPAGFVVLTGAMRLSRLHLEHTPHLCLPGPPAPFVVPKLLARDGVKAVLATVRIGPHIGYAISYFSPRDVEPPPLPNEWGTREYWVRERGKPMTMGSSYDADPAPDFDLRPWIEAAKLAWVAPSDAAMRLRWATPGCPYLTSKTPQRHQRVQGDQIF